MKLKNITNINRFFEEIENCNGPVVLVTNEGDRLNLKSQLCRYVAFANAVSDGKINEAEILTAEPEDMVRLLRFMKEG